MLRGERLTDCSGFSDSDVEKARTLTTDWMSQENQEPSCTACCLFNIMYELSERKIAPLDVKPIYKTVCKTLGYNKILGVGWDMVRPGMSKLLRKSKNKLWTPSVRENDRSLPVKLICDIIRRDNCSYPLMSLGPEYLRDEYGVELNGNPFHWFSHAVVVLQCSDGDCLMFDPFARQIMKDPIRIVSKERLNRYWYSTSPPRALAWFERKAGVLEEYLEG